jgi:hypothetical protein
MRRPALLIAGLLLATGSGLAIAAPASAVESSSGGDSSRWHCQRHYWDNDWDNDSLARKASADDRRRRDCRYRHYRHRWGNPWGWNSIGTVSGGVLVSTGGN